MNDQADPTPPPFDGRCLTLLTVAHWAIDMSQGTIPALLPLFIARHQLGYAAAAALVLASALASSIIQPLFGLFADRVSAPWLLPASLLATGGGLVGALLAPEYSLALAAIALCGVGVAAFHPEAARLVYLASGTRRTTGMGYFSIGGSLGFALAPLLVAGLLAVTGAAGLPVLLAPTALMAGLFGLSRGRLAGLAARHGPVGGARSDVPPGQWSPFALLGTVIAVRSAAFVGLNSFLVLYWVDWLGGDPEVGRIVLAVVLGSGVAGTVVGGWLADRWGRRLIIQGSMVVAAVLLGLLSLVNDQLTAALLLAPVGMALSAASSALVVLGQEYLPGRVGVASGVTIGLAVSCGGIAAPLLGSVADQYGVGTLPGVLAGLAAAAAALALPLPRPGVHHGSREIMVAAEAEPAAASGA